MSQAREQQEPIVLTLFPEGDRGACLRLLQWVLKVIGPRRRGRARTGWRADFRELYPSPWIWPGEGI